MKNKTLGVITFYPKEMNPLLENLIIKKTEIIGNHTYFFSEISDINIIAVCTNIGKVCAASVAAILISKFNVDALFGIGFAGLLRGDSVKLGDIILCNTGFYSDMNATPVYPKFTIPSINSQIIRNYCYENKKIINFLGTTATADSFITEKLSEYPIENMEEVVVADMESTAVSQVCEEFKIPFTCIRIISDFCTKDSGSTFQESCNKFKDKIFNTLELYILSDSIMWAD
ncbi:MAG: 5'-methylthioadenosine/S-adenosylhomocysteine nucleosidase [Ignavibacteria bacterium]|jgi:adenosylhomocysteine nucleosidase|nr:5'-methylthioadenosine/S-adenosylhomocysteine nucleosidase [Ignavibacteria bacterium]